MRKTMLFVNAMARNVQKPMDFQYFFAIPRNALRCRAESHKIDKNRCTVVFFIQMRRKSLYCRAKAMKIDANR